MSINSDERGLRKWHILLLFISVIAVWGAFWYYGTTLGNEAGTFGDMFGSANALFTGLASAGVIVTIILQSQELRLQRKELGSTREELAGQRRQLQRQNSDAFFFRLLDLLESRRKDISDSWRVMASELSRMADQGNPLRTDQTIAGCSQFITENYRAHTQVYFETLRVILLFIDGTESSLRSTYLVLLRAQFTDDEIRVIFYYGLIPIASNSVKPLVERLGLLRGFPAWTSHGEKTLSENYNPLAFQEVS